MPLAQQYTTSVRPNLNWPTNSSAVWAKPQSLCNSPMRWATDNTRSIPCVDKDKLEGGEKKWCVNHHGGRYSCNWSDELIYRGRCPNINIHTPRSIQNNMFVKSDSGWYKSSIGSINNASVSPVVWWVYMTQPFPLWEWLCLPPPNEFCCLPERDNCIQSHD